MSMNWWEVPTTAPLSEEQVIELQFVKGMPPIVHRLLATVHAAWGGSTPDRPKAAGNWESTRVQVKLPAGRHPDPTEQTLIRSKLRRLAAVAIFDIVRAEPVALRIVESHEAGSGGEEVWFIDIYYSAVSDQDTA